MEWLGVVFLLAVCVGCLYALRAADKHSAAVLGAIIGVSVTVLVYLVVGIA